MPLSNEKITELVAKLAAPEAEAAGCVLWDVEYVKEAGQRYLRVYIDNDNGVSIDQCEAVSRAVDKKLDELDPISEAYMFEVSSAGAERQLKRPSDFEKFIGHKVTVHLYGAKNGTKEYVGALLGYSNGDVEISSGGASLLLKKDEVASVRLKIDF